MAVPASQLIFSLSSVGLAKACFDRIQAYLLADTWEDARGLIDSSGGNRMMLLSTNHDTELINSARSETSRDDIALHDVSVKPASDADLAVSNISLNIKACSFVMIVGPVGSGKSTILKAMLGELPCQNGIISVSRQRMAYCSQSAWLPNGTIREIVSGCPDSAGIDQQWYDSSIHACALEEDVEQLPQGHTTVIGSKGLKLSGGQKQRLVSVSI